MDEGGRSGPVPPPSLLLRLYLAACALAWPLAGPLARVRRRLGREDAARWGERLGRTQLARPPGRLVWIHAASVGESLSVLPVVARLAAAGTEVLVTTNTVTSASLMQARLPPGARHQFLPYDFGPGLPRFLRRWRPDAAVLVEADLWPRLILLAHRRGVPLLLANARMSARSFARWSARPATARALLGRFARVLAPDEAMAGRLAALGVPAGRILVSGPLKAGGGPLPFDAAERDRLAAAFGGRPRWLAASTHAGEEAVAAAAHRLAAADVPGLLLVLAPRHPARGDEVAGLLRAAGLRVARRSAGEDPGDADVYLADTLGEMGLWFGLCPVAFMGGSLIPAGGHNPHEPAAQGAAILAGPEVGNFAAAYGALAAAGGAATVRDAATLAAAVVALQDPARRAAMVAAAGRALAAAEDAALATATAVLELAAGAR
ncbi:MAG: 3-deoxy-D-manno-octulosonic acid transferase [Rhodobacteraceae bacterium]|nr:3-deoxy-D-manno-octulosonic acid transferase [Paracoccaceae bacterium]